MRAGRQDEWLESFFPGRKILPVSLMKEHPGLGFRHVESDFLFRNLLLQLSSRLRVGAPGPEHAGRALGPRDADRASEIHERRIQFFALHAQDLFQVRLFSFCSFLRSQKESSQNTKHVRIPGNRRQTIGEALDSGSRVGPDTGELSQLGCFFGKLPSIIIDYHSGRQEHIAAAHVVAQAPVVRQEFFPARSRQLLDRRKLLHEALVIPDDARYLGLLEHDFRYPDFISGYLFLAPWQMFPAGLLEKVFQLLLEKSRFTLIDRHILLRLLRRPGRYLHHRTPRIGRQLSHDLFRPTVPGICQLPMASLLPGTSFRRGGSSPEAPSSPEQSLRSSSDSLPRT